MEQKERLSERVHITIPKAAAYILDTLHRAGYEAYVVGGCVRDSLLNRLPDDWDITTNATPSKVKDLFKRTIDTGIQHGTVTVMIDKTGYEVTTYRVDGKYEDHRRPAGVTFTASLKEDMLRRDFTINAMAYNEEEGLVDYFDGQEHLAKCQICCVGNPIERFDEDALRVLRAMRFAAQLGFTIHADTLSAMKENAVYLRDVSAERIRVELTKLLLSDSPKMLLTVGIPCGIIDIVLPELKEMLNTTQNNPHHCYNVGEHCVKAASYIEKDVVLRWAALLHDIGKPLVKTVDEEGIDHFYKHGSVGAPLAENVLRRLKFDNNTIKAVRELIYWHDYSWGEKISTKQVRKASARIGSQYMEKLFSLQKADVLAQSDFLKQEKLTLLEEVKERYQEVLREKQCISISGLALNGKDLMALGVKPGKAMGELLKQLLEQVLENPEYNTRECLTNLVLEKIKE